MIRISVIVFSYNRPRMLAEALKSIELADEIIVCDDGSTFDVDATVAASVRPGPSVRILRNPPIQVEERIRTARVGKLINSAIREAFGDVIAYLCDDDLFDPLWLKSVRNYYDAGGKSHWVNGWWGRFGDGGQITPIFQNPYPQAFLTTGNFAHLKSCAIGCGVLWSENSVAVHDAQLVGRLMAGHNLGTIPNVGLAGWRREHKYNMLKHVTQHDSYNPGVEQFLGGNIE